MKSYRSRGAVGLSIRECASGRSGYLLGGVHQVYIHIEIGRGIEASGTYMGKYRPAGIEWLFSG